ncbi:MAG: hypothetical protein ACUVQ1_06480 [Candidatus Kapaibacteriales bacterium]
MRSFNVLFILVLISTFLFQVGCEKKAPKSKLLNEKITQENFFDIITKAKSDTLLTNQEIELFANGISRFANALDTLYNKTVKEIIAREEQIRRQQNLSNLGVNVIATFSRLRYDGWKPIEVNGSKLNVFAYTIFNISNANIRKISGYLQFYTANNQFIRAYRLNIDQTIKSKQFTQFQSTFRAEEGNQNEEFLLKALQENPNTILVRWLPTFIELDNGKKLNLENTN